MNPQRPLSKSSNLNSWVVSSFGVLPAGKNKSAKNRNVTTSTKTTLAHDIKAIVSSRKVKTDDLWSEKYKPRTDDELAVHKRKYQDVRAWFEEHLDSNGSKMLLLTGPAGAGKTATVKILSNHLGFKIQEWNNQPGVTVSYGDNLFDESQVSTFRNFLLKSTRYKNQIFVDDDTDDRMKKQVIVVEEFPSCFSNNIQELHGIISSYARLGSCPIIFIITDGARNATNDRNFFPIPLQQELNITNISFNPIAQSNMVRSLSRIAEAEELSISKVALDAIAENSRGDIRSAINALQFGCSTIKTISSARNVTKIRTRGSKRTLKGSISGNDAVVADNLASFGSRDDSLFLFHALGKILHCKRDTGGCKEESILPANLKEMERFPLLVNPEDVWERTSLSGPSFTAFLHQNYIEFYSEITDISRAARYLSLSDVLSSYWTESFLFLHYFT